MTAAPPDHLRFLDALAASLAATPPQTAITAVCLLGLDSIGHADSLFGYRAGDTLCDHVTARLAPTLRAHDRIFRVGRGELACLLPGLATPAQALLAAHKIVRTLGHQLQMAPYTLYCTPHVGVAFAPDHGVDADALLQHASSALREARRRREAVRLHDADTDAAHHDSLRLQGALRGALADRALHIVHQPQVDLHSGALVGTEVLARWDSQSHGTVPPARFVAAAEQAGLMPQLSSFVLNAALREARALHEQGCDLRVSVNLSAQDLLEPELPDVVAHALGTWGVAAGRLVIEMTETAALDDTPDRRVILERLRALGVQLAIDDFGTGHSSLARLKEVPVSELKIDLRFVRDMLRDTRDEKIVRAIIELGHQLGLGVVAEGAEDAATLARLAAFGCDRVQGYAVSRPLPLAALQAWLAARPG